MTYNKQQLKLMTSGNVKLILITKYAYRKHTKTTAFYCNCFTVKWAIFVPVFNKMYYFFPARVIVL